MSLRERDCPFAIAPSNEPRRFLARHLFRDVGRHGVPERSPSNRETNESRDRGGNLQPMQHALSFGIPPEHNAPNVTPAAAPRGCDDMLAVLSAIEPFDLPDIRFNSGV